MTVQNAIVSLEYNLTYVGTLTSDQIREAERRLTRLLLLSYRARLRADWRDLRLDISSPATVAVAATGVLSSIAIRVDRDGNLYPVANRPVPRVKFNGNDPEHTIRYLYVSPTEHRIIYSFNTEFVYNTVTAPWAHRYTPTITMPSTYADGAVKALVSWAQPAEIDEADFEEQFALRELAARSAATRPFHTGPVSLIPGSHKQRPFDDEFFSY